MSAEEWSVGWNDRNCASVVWPRGFLWISLAVDATKRLPSAHLRSRVIFYVRASAPIVHGPVRPIWASQRRGTMRLTLDIHALVPSTKHSVLCKSWPNLT